MSTQTQKVSELKGRPMLGWTDKKPLETVQNYLTQLIETTGENTQGVIKITDYISSAVLIDFDYLGICCFFENETAIKFTKKFSLFN